MAQRHVDVLIGRLVTDDHFRTEFINDPEGTLVALRDRGLDLNPCEISALTATDRALWQKAADTIDPRLRKVSLHEA